MGEEAPHCALICISQMISDIEDLFIYLLSTCASLGKCLFKSSANFKLDYLFFVIAKL